MSVAPDILLILANRHRRDYTGFAKASLIRTPNIDRLAAEGIWFDRASAIFPQAEPSLASVLSGTYPAFDAPGQTLAQSPLGAALATRGYILEEIAPHDTAAETASAAVSAMKRQPAGPRMMMVRFPKLDHKAEQPREALDCYRGNGVPLAAQCAAVTACDMAVGDVMQALDSSPKGEQTIVVYASLVGDQFRYRDAVNRTNTCHDDCIRVPLILRLPGPDAPRGLYRKQLVGLHDIAPTLCDLAGARLEAGHGASLLPLVADEQADWRRTLYFQNYHPRHMASAYSKDGVGKFSTFSGWKQRAIWDGRHKLILSCDGGRHSMYDTLIDPEEEFDLFGAPRRTPHTHLLRFPDSSAKLVRLAAEMATCAKVTGDSEGYALAQNMANYPDPGHQPQGTPL